MPYTSNHMSEEFSEQYKRWHLSFDKKYKSRGQAIWVLHKRTLNTGLSVCRHLENVDFAELSTSLFHFSNGAAFGNLSKSFCSQIELAAANQDKFIKGLHQFYVNTCGAIKKEKSYTQYFAFFSYYQERGEHGSLYSEDVALMADISNALLDLIMQGFEYLRPDAYNLNQVIIGCKTDGTLMLGRDPYPYFDVPGYEIDSKAFLGATQYEVLKLFPVAFAAHGYPNVKSFDDAENIRLASQMISNQTYSLLTYINEYTIDILPTLPLVHCRAESFFPTMQQRQGASTENLKAQLHHRRRTLPANGARVIIHGSTTIREIYMKETVRDKSVCLLYKMTLIDNEQLSGYYNTQSEWFYSVLVDSNGIIIHEKLLDLLLWVYTAFTCDDANIMPTSDCFQKTFYAKTLANDKEYLTAEFFGIGGKARNMYDKDVTNDEVVTTHYDRDKYTAEQKAINGFVRRLPTGQSTSEHARLLAESMGYDLANNETYVQPFVRRQWLSKQGVE